MNKLLILVLSFVTCGSFAQNLQTVFEKSAGKETATYLETIQFYQQLALVSPEIKVVEKGITDSGEPLHLVIFDTDQSFDFNKARENGKTILLINNGIHPGEPDGIEASKMFLRDLVGTKNKEQYKNLIIAVIPVYNIGGALNRNSHTRANQNGPIAYGFRGNARNFDLNRDFIKADTRNARSFHEIFQEVKPDVFIDTHVSNGADYQYVITHLATQPNKMGGELGDYIEKTFIPQLEKSVNEKGSLITPYVNVFNSTPDKSGFSQFMDGPRYSTGYTSLFHTLGFMIETHMLKPFDQRVEASYHFIDAFVNITLQDQERIKAYRKSNEELIKPGNLHPITWKLDRSKYRTLNFKGYEGIEKESNVTGLNRLYFDHDKPFTKEIPYYNFFVPVKEVTIPTAYIIPHGWHEVIDRLLLNGAEFSRLKNDTTINVESYRIEKYNSSSAPYEGHFLHSNTEVSTLKVAKDFKAGDYVFPTRQFAGRYLVEVLEPEAPDSFFNWNFFDTILQQKEHFSPYVFEEVALQLLNENPDLKANFEKKKAEEPDFASNWYAQLNFLYMHSPHYEKAHMQYPVYRLME